MSNDDPAANAVAGSGVAGISAGGADQVGPIAVLAIDHRDSLRRFLAPDDPASVTHDDIVELKRDLVTGVADLATGVMLEPEFSIPGLVADLPDGVGFLAALESQGYLDDPSNAITTMLDGWSVEQALASGASMAKLLLPFHPDRSTAERQAEVAVDINAECVRVGLPLALEPLFFDLDDPADRPRVVHETVDRFASVGPALLKLPFPVDPSLEAHRDRWVDECARVTERCAESGIPWAMLSGGGTFESFFEQVGVARANGCGGFMVGRALWGEAARAHGDERREIIQNVVRPRFERLREIG